MSERNGSGSFFGAGPQPDHEDSTVLGVGNSTNPSEGILSNEPSPILELARSIHTRAIEIRPTGFTRRDWLRLSPSERRQLNHQAQKPSQELSNSQ